MNRAALTLGVTLLHGLTAAATYAQQPQRPGFTLTTPAYPDGGEIPQRYTQHDANHPISPALKWTNVPDGTASFVLIFHDPDVSIEKTLEDSLHWIVFNIPGTARDLDEGIPRTPQLPDGTIQPKNPRGHYGYRGPGQAAPPHHHYTFELFAVDRMLDLGIEATRADILKAIDGHILGKAVLAGRYYRH